MLGFFNHKEHKVPLSAGITKYHKGLIPIDTFVNLRADRRRRALVLVRSSFSEEEGTMLVSESEGMEENVVAGVSLDRDQARLFRASGRRAGSGDWPEGTYSGEIILLREGQEIDRITTRITVK